MSKYINILPYRITGDSAELLKQYDAASRKKIIQLGWFVLIPTFLWFFTGYLITSVLLGGSQMLGIFAGFICSIFIFIVERSIILAKKNHWVLVICRVILGVAIALFGSALLDLVIFKGDIDHEIKAQLSEKNKVEIESAYNKQIIASNNLNEEMRGTGGSKKRGFGEISVELKQQKEEAKKRVSKKENESTEIESAISNNNHPGHEAALEKLGFNTIAFRAGILHNLLKDDIFKMSIWVLLLIICFMMEFMPIITKLGSKKTAYELDQEAFESILTNRRKQALEKSDYYSNMGLVGRMVDQGIIKSSGHPLL